MLTETGWYWLSCYPEYSPSTKYKYTLTAFDTDGDQMLVFVRMDKKKFYLVSDSGTLSSYRINQINPNAQWKGPLKP